MATATMPVTDSLDTHQRSDLHVRLCGSSAHVPLQPDDGISALRSRVAGAFGLTVPFDLVGPEGNPLRTDEDAEQAALRGTQDGAAVRVGEDALLDLERSHEESGALRWALLRQIIGDMRTKTAENAVAIAEGHRKTSVLDQYICREKSSREAMVSSIKTEIGELRDQLALETHKARQEAKSAIQAAVIDITEQLQAATAAQATALNASADSLTNALRAEAASRQREADETLRRFEELRNALTSESKARQGALAEVASKFPTLEAQICEESQQRIDLQARLEASDVTLSKELEALAVKQNADLAATESSIAEAARMIQTEASARVESLARVEADVRALPTGFDDKMTVLRSIIDDGLASLRTMEPALQKLIVEEADARAAADGEHVEYARSLLAKIDVEVAERRTWEERTSGLLTALQEHSAQEQRAREAAASDQGTAVGSLAAKIEMLEKRTSDIAPPLRAEVAKAQQQMQDFMSSERAARETAFSEISSAQAAKHDALKVDTREMQARLAEENRMWAQALVDRLSGDLKGERESLFQELNRRCEELFDAKADANAERVRNDFAMQIRQVNTSTLEVARKQQDAMDEERHRYERQARVAAQEVKAALDAHGEFAEALKNEQSLLICRVQEALQQESRCREGLSSRVGGLEMDMQKVKGHLPILFASPSSFR
eukprot:TRINITY_DN35050_c0_g1_i1.p1 TRINITY_DN35050_c0_g1~~TRINITY_DN35050_c0_g1_i1.p1  ORF type:complete len:672 (-),score=171.02 TRINITY_DN35050_c0_g1_i1:428-2443(-)